MVGKERRFVDPKELLPYSEFTDYMPKYDCKYRKTPAAVIKKEDNLAEAKARKKKRYLMLLPELTTSEKVNLSVLTADTMAGVGPGSYQPVYTMVEVSKTVAISKEDRFKSTKKDEFTPLVINYEQVEANPRAPRMQKPSAINEKLAKKQVDVATQEEVRARTEIELAKKRQTEAEANLLYKQQQAEALRKREPTERERLMQLFRLVD